MKLLNSALATFVLLTSFGSTAFSKDEHSPKCPTKEVMTVNSCSASDNSSIKIEQQEEPVCDRIKCKWYPQNVWPFIPGCRGC